LRPGILAGRNARQHQRLRRLGLDNTWQNLRLDILSGRDARQHLRLWRLGVNNARQNERLGILGWRRPRQDLRVGRLRVGLAGQDQRPGAVRLGIACERQCRPSIGRNQSLFPVGGQKGGEQAPEAGRAFFRRRPLRGGRESGRNHGQNGLSGHGPEGKRRSGDWGACCAGHSDDAAQVAGQLMCLG
jgi:hypothetical protein